jgi:membrane protease YdiL (CAAX protease family)
MIPGGSSGHLTRRVLQFLRSVLPGDASQLIFLGGVVCLTIAPHLLWWSPQEFGGPAYLVSFGMAALPFVLAMAAGYFFCFWPVPRPERRILGWVLLPASVGFSLMCGRYLFFRLQPRDALGPNLATPVTLHSALMSLSTLGPGFRIYLIGLFLIAVFAWRLATGNSALPLALPHDSAFSAEGDASWRWTKILIWFVLAPSFVLTSLPAIAVSFGARAAFNGRALPIGLYWVTTLIADGFYAAIALWIVGPARRQVARRALRWCGPEYLALGLFFALGIGISISACQYLLDRIYWAAHYFGRFAPPDFGTYFTYFDPWLLFLFAFALGEELIFRGLLQPQLIQRYGRWRGIFLVGIVWAAFHFYTDFSLAQHSEKDALVTLGFRVFDCLALNYVLAWLTLRTGSILPSTISHGAYNISLDQFGSQFPGKDTLRVALWALLAYVLFRYWPVSMEETAKAPSE